jgi:cysteine desulfurase
VVYLDANATEPLRPEARAAMLAALDATGNPSSVHRAGRAARRILEDARETLAARFGSQAANVVFTSGGTEANALAIHALGADRRLIVGATEHDAVRAAARGTVYLPVDGNGVADLAALGALLEGMAGDPLDPRLRGDDDGGATVHRHPREGADPGVATLVCLMLANNETGTVQPVAAAATICRQHGALLHVDAVQAAGRMDVDLIALGAHSLAVSSHKLGGPAGAGALLLAPDAPTLRPLIAGGGQERGRRGGTPPLPAIAGFAAAARVGGDASHLAAFRDAVERAACAHGASVCGGDSPRLPNTTCLALPGVRADAQVIALDLDGIAVSAGAACSSGKVAESHVLAAMGLGPLAGQSIRVSLPWNASLRDVEAFAPAYARMADRLRKALVSHAA